MAHRANKGRTAAVAAVLRAYDELVSLGGINGRLGSRDLEHCLGSREIEHCCGNHVSFRRAAACLVPRAEFPSPHALSPCRLFSLFPSSRHPGRRRRGEAAAGGAGGPPRPSLRARQAPSRLDARQGVGNRRMRGGKGLGEMPQLCWWWRACSCRCCCCCLPVLAFLLFCFSAVCLSFFYILRPPDLHTPFFF